MNANRRRRDIGIVLREVDNAPQEDLSGFLGKEGKSVTLLRPVGDVVFDGRRMQVTSDGPFIDRGARVRVIDVQANKIIVSEVYGN